MGKQEFSVPALIAKVPTEADAYALLETLRWEDGIVCPHCGSLAEHYFLKPANGVDRKTRTGSRSERRVWKCRDCRKQFSVLTGTIFHGSKIPVRTWLMVIFELCASKNGLAAREIERKYDMAPKTAWFLLHRIREAMKREPLAGLLKGTVIADETWIGGTPKNMHRHKRPTGSKSRKTVVFSLVEKESGQVRSQVVPNVKGANLRKVIEENVDLPATVLHTDGHRAYDAVGPTMKGHEKVDHEAGEYVRKGVTTNHAEGYFSQLKRSLDGTHHHVSVEHLPRYLAEFDFRYNSCKVDDSERMRKVIAGTGARRLTYKPLTGASGA
jgi:transposase-like protein